MRKVITCIWVVCILATYAFAQEQEEDSCAKYKPSTLSRVVKAYTVNYKPEDAGIDIGSDPLRAKVIYTGESRPTPENKQRFIKLWMKSYGYPEEYAAKYGTELLFLEDSVKFWLPVQDVLIPHFQKEMRKDESVDIFAVWIGTTFPKDGKGRQGDHVIIVNEFEKPEPREKVKPE